MKICFIDPPHTFLMQERTQAPLGIMYMAAILLDLGHEVSISRPTGDDPAHWMTEIPESDLYAVSATSLGYGVACEIARTVKRERPGSSVIIGGYHATCEPDSVLAEPSEDSPARPLWDGVCVGEGIETRVLLMIGTPGEMPDTPEVNIAFLDSVPYTCASLTVFMPLPGSPAWIDPEACGLDILSRDLSRYNIYLWSKGRPDFNKNDDVVRIHGLTREQQINNTRRMVGYFLMNGKMNEIEKAKKQGAR